MGLACRVTFFTVGFRPALVGADAFTDLAVHKPVTCTRVTVMGGCIEP